MFLERDCGNVMGDEITKYIQLSLKERGILIPEEFSVSFNNHIQVFSQRLISGQFVDTNSTELEEQLSKTSMKEASEILAPLFNKYKVAPNRVEITLLAVYINLFESEENKKWESHS